MLLLFALGGAQHLFLSHHCLPSCNYLSASSPLEDWEGNTHPSWAGARPVGGQCASPSPFYLSLNWNASSQTGEESFIASWKDKLDAFSHSLWQQAEPPELKISNCFKLCFQECLTASSLIVTVHSHGVSTLSRHYIYTHILSHTFMV